MFETSVKQLTWSYSNFFILNLHHRPKLVLTTLKCFVSSQQITPIAVPISLSSIDPQLWQTIQEKGRRLKGANESTDEVSARI